MNRFQLIQWRSKDLLAITFLISVKHLFFAPKHIIAWMHGRCLKQIRDISANLSKSISQEQNFIEHFGNSKPSNYQRKVNKVLLRVRKAISRLDRIEFYQNNLDLNLQTSELLKEIVKLKNLANDLSKTNSVQQLPSFIQVKPARSIDIAA